jgi:NAD(P)-dependent dehydrogenase (short-subunit alcohol dehydrogenase family)
MGMGFATAKAFAEAGAAVVLADVNAEALEDATASLDATGTQTLAIRCDVSDEAEVAAMIDQIVSTFGHLDAAFNNAGVMTPSAQTADVSREEFDRVMAINLRGVWNCMKHELRQMSEQGSGAIVNSSSIGGLSATPTRGIYGAAKHGVIGLTKSAAVEYAPKGIRINTICPGSIKTPMVDNMIEKGWITMQDMVDPLPLGRLGHPEEIAAAVLWLCSPGASFVVGHSLVVDGGATI